MFTRKIIPVVVLCLVITDIVTPNIGYTSAANTSKQADLSEDQTTKIDEKVSKKRKEIINEAVTAVNETKKALIALEQKKTQDALKALEIGLGELEVVLARDPDLAFADIDTQVIIHDLYSSLEGIDQAKKQAEEYLEHSQVQKARAILKDLAYEVIISIVSIPLATYPEIIKDTVYLVDKGKVKEAKIALQTALDSLVVTNHVIPLGVIRAENDLIKAEEFAKKQKRTETENSTLKLILDNARFQLRMSEALGYGNVNDYKPIYKHLDEILNNATNIAEKSRLFDEIRKFFSDLAKPFD